MSIAATVREYLEELDVVYDIVEHPASKTSLETAHRAHLPANCLAKGVLIKDDNGVLSLAVVPSDRSVDLERVSGTLGHTAEIASESDVSERFEDCELGAVPPIGNAYALRVLLDERLTQEDEIYMEAGDHHELVHVRGDEFKRLMGGARTGAFSNAA
ncbi:MAG: YbaK/EbsC family protein [Rhodospirillales bacterium]|nr:MAG: YbaK/EbsC family protein [Rhodospirillales bacterium]